MSNSISDINLIPCGNSLKNHLRGIALVEAIIMPEWENRYFSFNKNWNVEKNEEMASMRDGSGNGYFLLFYPHGIVGKVIHQGINYNCSNISSEIPECFDSFKNEPAFIKDRASFFFWRKTSDLFWKVLPGILTDYPLLKFLVGGIRHYHTWAERYYEKKIDLTSLKQVYECLSVSEKNLHYLNVDLQMEDLEDDLIEII